MIAPEEIVHPDVDEHSVMTYLSQFPKAKLKPGAPLRPKQLFPDKAKAYGPGGWKEQADLGLEKMSRVSVTAQSTGCGLGLQVSSLTATR